MSNATKSIQLLQLMRAIRAVDSEFPPQTLEILLVVAANEPLSISEVQERVGLTLGAVSRNLKKLSAPHNDTKGLGFIDVDFAHGQCRRKEVNMTAKGLEFVGRLLSIL